MEGYTRFFLLCVFTTYCYIDSSDCYVDSVNVSFYVPRGVDVLLLTTLIVSPFVCWSVDV